MGLKSDNTKVSNPFCQPLNLPYYKYNYLCIQKKSKKEFIT
jgi:hypothetical protein